MTPAEGLLKRVLDAWDSEDELVPQMRPIILEIEALLSRAPQGQECCEVARLVRDMVASETYSVAALKSALTKET